MNELVDKLRAEFQEPEYRHAYAEECLNTMIAAQIKAIREQRGMTQGQLAEATGMMQPRIPLLEDASYSNWTVNTLKRIARAFDVALSVNFETFSRVVDNFENMSRRSLERPTFANDPRFERRRRPRRNYRHRRMPAISRQNRLQSAVGVSPGTVISSALYAGKPPRREEVAAGELLQQPTKAPQAGAAL